MPQLMTAVEFEVALRRRAAYGDPFAAQALQMIEAARWYIFTQEHRGQWYAGSEPSAMDTRADAAVRLREMVGYREWCVQQEAEIKARRAGVVGVPPE